MKSVRAVRSWSAIPAKKTASLEQHDTVLTVTDNARPARSQIVSHALPDRHFWEASGNRKFKKWLILLVGAAGFEPTTCSTQNLKN
jgi:hypothetical protein